METKRAPLAELTRFAFVHRHSLANVKIERLPNHGKKWQLTYSVLPRPQGRALYTLG